MTVNLPDLTGPVRAYGDQRVAEAVGPLQAKITELQAQVDALEPPDPPNPSGRLIVGAACNVPTGPSLTNFKAADKQIGPLTVRRSFPQASAGKPIEAAVIAAAAADQAAGYTSFLSWKPSLTEAQLKAIAKGVPDGTYLTQRHEPQNDMRGAAFVVEYTRAYDIVKAANPKVLMGPVDLAYAWRNRAGVGNAGSNTGPLEPPPAWDPGDAHKDFTGLDIYAADGVELAKYERFGLWLKYNLAASSKPLVLAEYGQVVIPPGAKRDPAREARRAQVITADAAYLPTIKRLVMWLYWCGTGAQGDWFPYDSGSQQAWRAVATRA